MVTASVMWTKNPSEKDRSAALGGLMFGIPAVAGGTVILMGSRGKKKELAAARERQLETTFLELLTNDNGRISVVEFALASQLSIDESKQYLDRKVNQLNGDFDVSDDGKISYRFDYR